MSCKAAIYTANQGVQALQIGSVLSLGSIIRRFGRNCNNTNILDLNGNGITISEPGYYDVDASITATAAAAGTVTVTLLRDGVAVPGAVASATAAAAGTVALPITALVRQMCGNSGSTLTLVLGGTAATINNVALKVIKL